MNPKDIIKLASAAMTADYQGVRRAANTLARNLADDGFSEDAAQLRALVRKKGVPLHTSGHMEQLPVDIKSRTPLVEEQTPPDTPLFLNKAVHDITSNFIEDVKNIDRLTRNGIASRLSLMLSGMPGTGKSLLAGHIAIQLERPLYVVRLDSVISSLLGDTAKNIRAIFDYIPIRNAVLFLDEIDAVAKLRDDRHELGELKRVVNTVIQGLDSLDDGSIVIAATNHPQLLDPAIWRRFPYQIEMDLPDYDVRKAMWLHFLFNDKPNELSPYITELSSGLSGAEIETISLNIRRRMLLSGLTEVPFSELTKTLIGGHRLKETDNKELTLILGERGFKPPQIAKLLNISRQWALKLLNEVNDG